MFCLYVLFLYNGQSVTKTNKRHTNSHAYSGNLTPRQMASRAGSEGMPLQDPAETELWLRITAATAKTKGFVDTKGDYQITNFFMSKAGMEAIREVSLMVKPENLEDICFDDIRKKILAHVQPKKKLVIAERTNFMSLRQEPTENVAQYMRRLRGAALHCEFNSLNDSKALQTGEDDLIQMRLIDGLHDMNLKMKLLEFLQSSKSAHNLSTCVEFLQQLEQIKEYKGKSMPEKGLSQPAIPVEVAHVDNPGPGTAKRKQCYACGMSHARNRCPAFGKTCVKCQKKNHFARVCRGKPVVFDRSAHHLERDIAADDEDEASTSEIHTDFVFSINHSTNNSSLRQVSIEGCKIAMQLDSGSQVSIIPKNLWEDLGKPALKKTSTQLKQFDGTIIKTLGCFTAMIEYGNRYFATELTVANCIKRHGLLGTDVLSFDQVSVCVNKVEQVDEGCLKGFKASIKLRDNARPAFYESRSIPIHLRPLVSKKLQLMLEKGIVSRVPPGGSKWASPLVIIRKPDGDVRICVDYKMAVNPQIYSDSFPIPDIETAFSEMAGMTHFAKIDLTNAYNQIELDETSKDVTTMNTPIGLLRWNRLPFGIKTASAIFQSAIMATLNNVVSNMIIYQDDICIGAQSEKELTSKVDAILKKLKEVGMRINESKSVMCSTELSFLGHSLGSNGIRPDRRLVDKISGIQKPKNKKELDSYVGLVNYYGRYIDRFAERIAPLNELRSRQSPFIWTDRQDSAFYDLREALTSRPVVQPFDPQKLTTLTTDASEKAISAILSQDNHPVIYLSRKLKQSEQSMSNIEREALAIVWATQRARHFLLGSKFLLKSDHRPLEFIFHPNKALPKVTSARIARWAVQLTAFDYDIEYVKGSTIPHVDALSRLSFTDEDVSDADYTSLIHWIDTDVLNLSEVQADTERDNVLKSVMTRVKTGKWSNCSASERPYKCIRNELSVDNGVLCKRDLIVPPITLRKQFISAVHDDVHGGISNTRNRLRV